MQFEWDSRRATSNLHKHGVAFADATSVFADPLARIFDDPDHSTREEGELIVGYDLVGRLPIVSFAERGDMSASSVQGVPRHEKFMPTKSTSSSRVRSGLRKEYDFDYADSRPNRFAANSRTPQWWFCNLMSRKSSTLPRT